MPYLFATLLLIAFATANATPANDDIRCDIPTAETDDGSDPIRSRAELDAWLARCPSPLDPLRPGTRQRFLDGLRFNERGVVDYPVDELTDALTTDEIRRVSRLLGLDVMIPGLHPEEAVRLRGSKQPAGISAIERRYDRFHEESRPLERELDGAERGAALVALYQSIFPSEVSTKAVGVHDLGLLYRAASTTAFYSEDARMTEVAQDAYARLSASGLSTRSQAKDMMKLILDAGRVNDARELALAEPEHELPLLPTTRDGTNGRQDTSVWDLGARDALVRRHISLSPVRIVVRASLGCRYSMAAAEAIAADPELGPLFREHAVWLAPPAELIGYERLRAWNTEHPHTPIVVAADWADWPMLDRWEGTPTFHVFRDGELTESVTSWPIEEGNRDAVLDALRKAGLR